MFIDYPNTNCLYDIVAKKEKSDVWYTQGKIMSRDRELLIPLLPLNIN